VRRAFYQRVGAGQRMQWHRLIAASLMATYGTSAEEVAAELAMHFEQGGEPLEAVRQLAVAAARAVARGAAQDALRGARHGLQLLDGLAPAAVARVECEELELELRVLEGVALTRLHVISTAPVAAAFDCAGALADRAGPSTARARALFGRWRVSFARAEVAQARRLAMHMLERAGGDDPALAAAARCALGCTLAMMGDLLPARRELQDVLASGEADRATGIFVHDPGVVARGYLALVLWWAGDPVPARRLAAEAVARADELRHPLSQLIALNLAAGLHFDAGEYERVLTCVDDLHEVIRRHGLPQVPGSFSWLRGHALTRLGRPEDGLGEMRDGLRCLEQGMRTGLSGYYLHYAEALRDVGRPDDAAAAVDEGLRFGDDTGERVLLPALLCLKAELTSTRGQADVANAALDRASELARRQGAAFHEIGVHVLSARLRGRRGQDESAATGRLRHLLQLFEGEQAPMLVAARMLLGA
jgi:tetratricopeptide (TPR) repeat protein